MVTIIFVTIENRNVKIGCQQYNAIRDLLGNHSDILIMWFVKGILIREFGLMESPGESENIISIMSLNTHHRML